MLLCGNHAIRVIVLVVPILIAHAVQLEEGRKPRVFELASRENRILEAHDHLPRMRRPFLVRFGVALTFLFPLRRPARSAARGRGLPRELPAFGLRHMHAVELAIQDPFLLGIVPVPPRFVDVVGVAFFALDVQPAGALAYARADEPELVLFVVVEIPVARHVLVRRVAVDGAIRHLFVYAHPRGLDALVPSHPYVALRAALNYLPILSPPAGVGRARRIARPRGLLAVVDRNAPVAGPLDIDILRVALGERGAGLGPFG
mmetsp:Transcript_25835/g.45891  ORF Transcript_25835/g.45891 Transcript_25835/m.45891 type:complete len:260 (+) Transcript_25835:443-1222(+)